MVVFLGGDPSPIWHALMVQWQKHGSKEQAQTQSKRNLYTSKPAGAPPPVLYMVASLQATPSTPRLASPTWIYKQNVTKKHDHVQIRTKTTCEISTRASTRQCPKLGLEHEKIMLRSKMSWDLCSQSKTSMYKHLPLLQTFRECG